MPNITLSDATRQILGQRFRDWIQAGLDQKGTGPTGWWREVERFYRNEQPESPGKNIVPFHVPISQPRQDALTANVCTVIAKQEPIMLCDLDDTDLADRREKFVHKAWQEAGIEVQLRKISTDATNINKGFVKITERKGKIQSTYGPQRSPGATQCPGVEIGVVKAGDMSVYPAVIGGIQEAVCVGNRLWKTVGSVKALIKSGTYYKKSLEPSPGDPNTPDDSGGKNRSGSIADLAPDMDTRGTQLWDVVIQYDLSLIEGCEDAPKGENRYRATIAYDTLELLSLEEYPAHYRYIWYFDFFYIPDGDNYWPAMSVARNLKSLQDAYNKLAAAFYTYALAAAKPVVIGPPIDTGETYSQWNPGDYLATDEPATAWSPSITFQGQPLVVQMQQIERIADMVARVSQNTMGSIQGHTTTATTDSIVASGVATGLEEYISSFSTPMPLMAEHTEDVLAGMWDEIQPYYTRTDPSFQAQPQDPANPQPTAQAPQVPLLNFEELAMPTSWKCNGMSPSATPQARVQAAMQMAELSQDPAYGIDKYALGTVITKDSPLSGTGGIQMPKAEVEQEIAAQQQAEQAANAPPQKGLSETLGIKFTDLSPAQQAWVLEQDGMPANIAAMVKPPEAATNGKPSNGKPEAKSGDAGSGGDGANGEHDAALAGAISSPELKHIAQVMAQSGGGQMPPGGPSEGAGPAGAEPGQG